LERVRPLVLLAVVSLVARASAAGQLAITQPTEKLLLLPLPASAADSAASIQLMDAARDRLSQLARYKALIIPKPKICEALTASGFPCDALLEDQQVGQLARVLGVNSYDIGTLVRGADGYRANIRIISGSSGFTSVFTIRGSTPPAAAESLAQHLNTVIRAGEYVRDCADKRGKNNLQGALDAAQKALAIDPNFPSAWLCISTVYEVKRLGPDSIVAAAQRALKGDSMNANAWHRIADALQQKGDTLKWLDALMNEVRVEPDNRGQTLGVANQLFLRKQYLKAIGVLDIGLRRNPADQQLKDMKRRVCIEGEQWRCVIDLLAQDVKDDTTKLADSTELKLAIGAAQALPDTQQLLFWTKAAVTHYSKSQAFWNTRGSAFDLAGLPDSALAAYKKVVEMAPGDARANLLVATTMLNRLVYDTLHAPRDTSQLKLYKAAFADRVDSVKPYLQPALAGSDTALRINAAFQMITAGSKLGQAAIYDRAYPWLDQVLTIIAPKAPADSVGPVQQLRVQGSFWFGLSSTLSIGAPYGLMIKDKSCAEAKEMNDRLVRTRGAMTLGARIAPGVANQILGILTKYQDNMPKVKEFLKCKNF
jgi:tetratricopeptide (TPR) repeat protein